VSRDGEQELLDIAVEVAHRAGELLLGFFRGPARGIGTKTSATDPVSDADREAEELIRTILSKRRPDDGMIGEEGVATEGPSGVRWIVDPLDGTVNFLFGRSDWAVSIAVEDADGDVAGVIHDPMRGETFTAIRGHGARLDGEPITVSRRAALDRALVGTGFSYDAEVRARQAAVVSRLLPLVRDVRRAGSAALDLAALACGRLDAFYEAPMERWDRAAGVLIAREAGAIVTDLAAPRGMPAGVVGANPQLHPALSKVVTDEK
jgi:myo-inositol-1(or 4)-monophosphatase